ncbi:MAG: peptidase M38 [Rhodobacteraceae bacterium]|nr:peptidase M38 [Paracoccaceae bacterium]MAY47244.1 peptidase M38 [Paracoccaceae bacterium]
MTDILFRNARVLDPEAGRLRPGMSVLVRGRRFAGVAEGAVDVPHATVVDLGGRVMMPGLIDCHVHVTSIRTTWANKSFMHMLPSIVAAHTWSRMHKMLMRGFTTARDVGGADRGHREAVEEGLVIGPRLFICGSSISQTGGHGDQRTRVDQSAPHASFHLDPGGSGRKRIADGVTEVRRAVRDEIRLGADHIKLQVGGGVGSPADPIHFVQFSRDELRAAVEEAHNADTYVACHSYTAKAVARAVEAGIRSIEHANFLDEPTAALMVERGALMVPTLVAYEATMKHGAAQGYPEENLKKNARVLSVGTRSLEIARAAGVAMAFGTDLIGELDGYQNDEFEIRARVLSNAEIIRQATVNGAEVVRRRGELGVIAKGAFADALVLDGDPLQDIGLLASGGRDFRVILADGRVVKDADGLTGLPVPARV